MLNTFFLPRNINYCAENDFKNDKRAISNKLQRPLLYLLLYFIGTMCV